MSPDKQATLAVREAVDAMAKVEEALERPARRNELYLLHVLPPAAADAFLKTMKEEKPTTLIDDILHGVPDAAHVVEQHSKLLRTAGRTATIAEALDLAERSAARTGHVRGT